MLPEGKSLFSTNQIRHNGHQVYDVPQRYGGRQKVIIQDQEELHMIYHAGICCLKIRKPTSQELTTLPLIVLTSEEPWSPHAGESDPYDDLIEHEGPTFQQQNHTVMVNRLTSDITNLNMEHIQKCHGWKPLEVVKETLSHTTQLATNNVRLPMREHYKSRFPSLNARRIQVVVATDTFFAAEKALGSETCEQLYVGKKSCYTRIYGMKTESQVPNTLGDFIREIGAPYALLSDNAKSETSEAIKDYLRKYRIKDIQTEPLHPNQNPAEHRIQKVKSFTLQMMDRSSSPNYLWMLCMEHTALILNHLSHNTLGSKTPHEKMFGVTPQISAIIQFHW